MSNTTTQQPAAQAPEMDARQAHATLTEKALLPLYFAKLAEYGIRPSNEQEAQGLATLCYQVLDAREQGRLQPAGSRLGELAKRASARLSQVLGQTAPQDPQAEDDHWAKLAAQQCMQSAELQHAAVVYQTALLGPAAQAA